MGLVGAHQPTVASYHNACSVGRCCFERVTRFFAFFAAMPPKEGKKGGKKKSKEDQERLAREEEERAAWEQLKKAEAEAEERQQLENELRDKLEYKEKKRLKKEAQAAAMAEKDAAIQFLTKSLNDLNRNYESMKSEMEEELERMTHVKVCLVARRRHAFCSSWTAHRSQKCRR